MKNKKIKLIITIFWGIFGIHKFIDGKPKLGILYLFTAGLCGIGWIIDILIGIKEVLQEENSSKNKNEFKSEHIKVKEEKNIVENEEDNEKHNANDKTLKNIEKIRNSTSKFVFLDNDKYLRYSYYDIELKCVEYKNFDISKIEINHQLYFQTEPNNEYDKNAIKVLYDDIFIGYIPKNNLQEMMISYSKGDSKQVCGMITLVDEKNKIIKIGLAFYNTIDNKVEYLDTKLIKTTKKCDLEDRQENLLLSNESDEVKIEYDFNTETYIVTDDELEIGEISKSVTKKLKDYEEDGYEFKAGILEISDNDVGNYECKIRIIIR